MRNEATGVLEDSSSRLEAGQTLWRIRYVLGSVNRPPRIFFAFLAAVLSALSRHSIARKSKLHGRSGSRSSSRSVSSLTLVRLHPAVSCCPLCRSEALLARLIGVRSMRLISFNVLLRKRCEIIHYGASAALRGCRPEIEARDRSITAAPSQERDECHLVRMTGRVNFQRARIHTHHGLFCSGTHTLFGEGRLQMRAPRLARLRPGRVCFTAFWRSRRQITRGREPESVS